MSPCTQGKEYLMRMMTEGVWAIAPTRLQTHTIHRKMRKASWQPGIGHFPGTAVASSLSADIQEHPLRFCEGERQKIQELIKFKRTICTEALTELSPSDSKKEPDGENYISTQQILSWKRAVKKASSPT